MRFFLRFFRRSEKGQLVNQAPLADYLQISDPSKPTIVFQVAEEDARRIVLAFAVGGFVRFTTTFGRHCLINLDQVPSIRHFKAPKSSKSTFEIEGALVQLVNTEPVDIPIDQSQIEALFGAIAVGECVTEIGDWRFKTSSMVAVVLSEKYDRTRSPI